jgi:hypothetical protein
MARFSFDPSRLNYNIVQKGKEYNLRLFYRSQAIFKTLLDLLPSNYSSTIEGPNYTLELKAVAVELARLELALEDVSGDLNWGNLPNQQTTRSDFLYTICGYLLLVNGQIPTITFSDNSFQTFLLGLLQIYFQGSIPKSISDAVALFYTGAVTVTENFLLVRQGASGYDISDEFGFGIDVVAPPGGGFPPDVFDVDSSIRLILDIIRPAHTLYTIRYIFQDTYVPNGTNINKILDAMSWYLHTYYYEDFRSYWAGIRDRDRLGVKVNKAVVSEDHSKDF